MVIKSHSAQQEFMRNWNCIKNNFRFFFFLLIFLMNEINTSREFSSWSFDQMFYGILRIHAHVPNQYRFKSCHNNVTMRSFALRNSHDRERKKWNEMKRNAKKKERKKIKYEKGATENERRKNDIEEKKKKKKLKSTCWRHFEIIVQFCCWCILDTYHSITIHKRLLQQSQFPFA